MPSARSLLNQLKRHQAARAAPRSPIEIMYGSFDAFADKMQADVEARKLDRIDWLGENGTGGVLAALRRWHKDGVWRGWR